MRVLVITHVYPRWAGDSQAPFLGTWAKAIVESGHDLLVLAPHDDGAALNERLDGVPIRRVRYGADGNQGVAYRGQMHELVKHPAGFAQLMALSKAMRTAIHRALQAFKPDLIHVHWWVPGMLWVKGLAGSTPVVCHLHGTDMRLAAKNPATAALARWAMQGCAQIQAVSTDLSDQAQALTGRAAIPVNPMPLNPVFFNAPTHPMHVDLETATVLGVGRLVESKGWADLIRACAHSPIPLRVRIIGEGPQRHQLSALAAALSVPLELPGTLPPEAMVREYTSCDVVVHPSHREGFGMVIPEAIMCHRPVIATHSGGVADLLDPADLIPVGDIGGLRAAIQAALDDPAMETLAGQVDQVANYLSPQAGANRTLTLWESVLG